MSPDLGASLAGAGFRSLGPVRPQDYFAEVDSPKAGIHPRQHVRLNVAEGRLRPVLYTVVKGPDDIVLEVGPPGMRGDDLGALLLSELRKSDSEHVHFDARRHQRYLRAHVLGNSRRGVKSDRRPHHLRRLPRHLALEQKRARRVRPINLEPLGRAAMSAHEADIVEYRAHVQQLRIKREPTSLSRQ